MFVAVRVAPWVAERLEVVVDNLRPRVPSARWTDLGQAHVTLRFLGEVERAALAEVGAALASAAAGFPAVRLGCRGLGAFPDPQRARVLWAGVMDVSGESATLGDLALRVSRAVERWGGQPDRRPFRPHVTLARLRAPARVGQLLAPHREADHGAWTVDEVVLLESVSTPAGSVYEELARVELAAPMG